MNNGIEVTGDLSTVLLGQVKQSRLDQRLTLSMDVLIECWRNIWLTVKNLSRHNKAYTT